MGGRTLKTGQSRCFVGYKKHTLRLWLHHYPVGVQLVPLVSWATPANVSEGGLLVPSLIIASSNRIGIRRWSWRTWGIGGPQPNNHVVSGGAWRSWHCWRMRRCCCERERCWGNQSYNF